MTENRIFWFCSGFVLVSYPVVFWSISGQFLVQDCSGTSYRCYPLSDANVTGRSHRVERRILPAFGPLSPL
jgi:hypothetical protein